MAGGVEIQPISVGAENAYVNLLESDPPKTLDDPDIPYGWTNYYRRDDVCAVAFFYLDAPETHCLPSCRWKRASRPSVNAIAH